MKDVYGFPEMEMGWHNLTVASPCKRMEHLGAMRVFVWVCQMHQHVLVAVVGQSLWVDEFTLTD